MIRDVAEAQQSLRSPQGGTAGPVSLPTIKFYKDANLLIVIGSPEAEEMARRIVNALPGEDPFSAANYDARNQIMGVIPGQNKILLQQMGVQTTNSQ
jgi:hypothetical protein